MNRLQNPYFFLNESTVRGWLWFDEVHQRKVLKPRFQKAVDYLGAGYSGEEIRSHVMHPGAFGLWAGHVEEEKEFMDNLKRLWAADVGFNSSLIQFQMKAFISVKIPGILRENGGPFQISRPYVRKWTSSKLGWTYPGQERTYANKGAANVIIEGAGDKRLISVMISSSMQGHILPMQAIFEGKTCRSTPGGEAARVLAANGFDVTALESHWTTQITLRGFVRRILVPWIQAIWGRLGLNAESQKAIWLIDAYSVHKSVEFRTWMRENHPNICLLYIPANCTSKLQSADVLLMRPFKCAIQREFGKWAVSTIKRQMEAGISAESTRLETSIVPPRNIACDWLFKAYNQLRKRESMIKAGWEKIGFSGA
ncbi:hypothetical protein R1sor_018095 [Riccia sorocarpa]|uniref:DDE-1 domain-containing protein n=1 Tax=Riccia sorocarpa TaxID=122646 RepID=A0ABD3I8Q8_9MARC